MVVRIPAICVGLAAALVINAFAFVVADWFQNSQVLVPLLPFGALLGGVISARWARRIPPVPGFAVGLMILAVRIGLVLGLNLTLLASVDPVLAILEVIAAITGGMLGTLMARRAQREAQQPKPEFTPLS